MKLKKGDNVIVITGKDRGKKGKVAKTLPALDRVIVEGVNTRKKRQKPRRAGEKGQVIDKAQPLHVSNVLTWCDKCGKGVRLGSEYRGQKKVRICRTCSSEIK